MLCSEVVENANQRFYDQAVERYRDMLRQREDSTYANFLNLVKCLIPREACLLDVGTGTGKILDLVGTWCKAVGVDISFNMLRVACSVKVVQTSCFQLPFADCTFGGATAYSVLHHLYSVEPLFHEIYRILKPGSWLITDNDSNALFHHWFGWWLKIRRFFKRSTMNFSKDVEILYVLSEYRHLEGLSAGAIKVALHEAGFENVSVKYCHPPTPDWFTKILTKLEVIVPKEICRYYLRVSAQKL